MSTLMVTQDGPHAQDALRTSASVEKIIPAFIKAQSEFPAVKKDQTGKVEGEGRKGNAYSYEYSYADLAGILAVVQPVLKAHGLGIMQPIVYNGVPHLLTRLLHESGEWMEASYRLAAHDRPQDMGSEITYARRYSLTSFLGIATEDDDDGAAATRSGGKRTSGKSNLPLCPSPACKGEDNSKVMASKTGTGYYCHGCKQGFQAAPVAAPKAGEEQKAPAPAGERVPGGDDAEVPGEPPRARIPAAGAKSWEDAGALGAECLRLAGGSVKEAGTILAGIAGGLRTARGMKSDAVRAAWLELSRHATFGTGGAK